MRLEVIPATGVPSSAAAFTNIDPDLVSALCCSQPINDFLTPLPAYSNRVHNTLYGLTFTDKILIFLGSAKHGLKLILQITFRVDRS